MASKKQIDYLGIRKAGGLELFFALLMILSSYSFMGVPLQPVLWALLFFILFFRRKRINSPTFRPLLILIAFVLIHDLIYLFIANGRIFAYLEQIIFFGCMVMAIKVFDIDKLKGSLNLVAVIAILGLLYQWTIVAAGGEIRPIGLPFLDMGEMRMTTFTVRPSSFFMEPAAYVAFMYIPLAFALIDKKFVWAAIIVLTEFLTTSTTGIVTSFIMVITYVFTQRIAFRTRLFTALILVGMACSLIYVGEFQTGVEKLETTDLETNIRLAQGPYIVSTMKPYEMIVGAPYHNAFDYCKDARAPNVVFYDEEVFISTIWQMILKYGFVGLFLYLMFFVRIVRKLRKALPLVLCVVATMFSSGFGVGMYFVYLGIPLILMLYYSPQE